MKVQKPATSRALSIPHIREEIVSHLDDKARVAVSVAGKDFYETVRQPKMWANQYFPASVDYATQTIYTSYRLSRYKGDDRDPLIEPWPKRCLGLYRGEIWHLKTEQQLDGAKSPVTKKMLLAVRAMSELSKVPYDVAVCNSDDPVYRRSFKQRRLFIL